MSPARILPSQRSEMTSLRRDLGLLEPPPELRELTSRLCHEVTARLGEELPKATRHHPQSCSRRELMLQATHNAVGEFAHLVDPEQPAPRWSGRLFHRLGRAEADAGWEIDVVLDALECAHTLWWQAVVQWDPRTPAALLTRATRAFTGHLFRLHEHAVNGQTTALSQAPPLVSPLRLPRPELALMDLVDQWQASTGEFAIHVNSRARGLTTPGRLTATDHVVSLRPWPALPVTVEPEEAAASSGPVPADQVLDAYRDCLLALRLVEAGVLPRGGVALAPPEATRIPLHPGPGAVARIAPHLSWGTTHPVADRVASALDLQRQLCDPQPTPAVPIPRHAREVVRVLEPRDATCDPRNGPGQHPGTGAGDRLALLGALRLVVGVWLNAGDV